MFFAQTFPFHWTEFTDFHSNQTKDSSLFKTAKAFLNYLAERNSSLEIIFLPTRDSLYSAPDQQERRTALTPTSRSVWEIKSQLEKAGIKVSYPLKEFARADFILQAPLFTDDVHYLNTGHEIIAGLRDPSVTADVVYIGDCHASSVASLSAQYHGAKTSSLGRNAAGTRMAAEVSLLPEGFLPLGSHVTWLIMDRDVQSAFPPPQAPAQNLSSSILEGYVSSKISKPTLFPEDLPTVAPYSDCLIAHIFEFETGESFVGVIQLMRDRAFIAGVELWAMDSALIFQLMPWADALKSQPQIRHMQLLDDTQEWALPRYWIKTWLATTHSESSTSGKSRTQTTGARDTK